MSRSCNCFTTWGTNTFSCSDCWRLDAQSRNNAKAVVEKFANDLMAELAPRGSTTLRKFYRNHPRTPGTSTRGATLVSQYCTSNDWFRARNFNLIVQLDGKPVEDLTSNSIDCTPIDKCGGSTPDWIGYWWIVEKTCNCVGPTPIGIGGVQVGELQKISETFYGDAADYKTVSKSLVMEANWEQQSGKICGEAVEDPGTPPQPDLRWVPKNKFSRVNVNFRYQKVKTKWMAQIENTSFHSC